MGFFKNIFKAKKGGTFVGNLIRGVASKATGGILGSGQQLAKRDAKADQKAIEKELKQQQAFQTGEGIVNQTPELQLMRQISETPIAQKAGKAVAIEWAKKYWYYIVGGVVLIGVAIWYFGKPKTAKRKY